MHEIRGNFLLRLAYHFFLLCVSVTLDSAMVIAFDCPGQSQKLLTELTILCHLSMYVHVARGLGMAPGQHVDLCRPH